MMTRLSKVLFQNRCLPLPLAHDASDKGDSRGILCIGGNVPEDGVTFEYEREVDTNDYQIGHLALRSTQRSSGNNVWAYTQEAFLMLLATMALDESS
jgi:hypothetical protein